jgi:ubiquinone/menaquinone biosynthesis C-methylase UbiE
MEAGDLDEDESDLPETVRLARLLVRIPVSMTTSEMRDSVWRDPSLVAHFLAGVRGGLPYAADQLAIMIRIVAASGSPVRRFLDVGSGAGAVAEVVLRAYPDADATLVDFSPPMMEAAQERLGTGARRHYVLADFGDASWVKEVSDLAPFDLVVSGFAIHHQPDQRKREIYREIFDLLAPGGWFLNNEHVASSTRWLQSVSDELLVDSLFAYHQQMGTGKTREQVASEFVYRPDKAANILAPVEEQCAWLREIGYQDVDCYFKVFELAVFGGRKPASR